MKFTKMHGIGNDYLFVNCFEEMVADPERMAIVMSRQHFGAGSDGLVLIEPADGADFGMRIFNSDGSEADRTFVSLADGATAGYDLNMDLGKIMNSGANLYTLCGNIELAGNSLPVDAGSVAVGVRVAEAGTYMLGMHDMPEGWTVVLCDSLLGREVNLRYADYETQLDAGVHNTRFALRFVRAALEAPNLKLRSRRNKHTRMKKTERCIIQVAIRRYTLITFSSTQKRRIFHIQMIQRFMYSIQSIPRKRTKANLLLVST